MASTTKHHAAAAKAAFKSFCDAESLLDTVETFGLLQVECVALGHAEGVPVWKALRSMQLHTASALHDIIKAKAESCENYKSKCCSGMRVVIVGGGPGGFCTGIEAALLGADVFLAEKRPYISRNNVMKLWAPTVDYFHSIGLKVFYKQLGNTGSDKVAIRRLQLVAMKVALLVGVHIEVGAQFVSFTPGAEGSGDPWTVEMQQDGSVSPSKRDLISLPCDALIGADGENSQVAKMAGFGAKMVQFSNALGLTFNFKRDRTSVSEMKLQELARSGMYFKKWFEGIKRETGVLLENCVYFKDETHYFVMATKPSQFVQAGILKEMCTCQEQLLESSNIDHEKLCKFARQMAKKVGLPEDTPFAENHRGKPDMGIFDFTKKLACTEPMRLLTGERPLLVKLVGDALIAPFWPLGTGCNKAVLGALDAGHALKRHAAALASPEAPRLHVANLQEQLTIFYQLKAVLSGEDLRPNRGHGAQGEQHYAWRCDPTTRYARQEADAQESMARELLGIPGSPKEVPLEAMAVDMMEAMSSYGVEEMAPGLGQMFSAMGFETKASETVPMTLPRDVAEFLTRHHVASLPGLLEAAAAERAAPGSSPKSAASLRSFTPRSSTQGSHDGGEDPGAGAESRSCRSSRIRAW